MKMWFTELGKPKNYRKTKKKVASRITRKKDQKQNQEEDISKKATRTEQLQDHWTVVVKHQEQSQ